MSLPAAEASDAALAGLADLLRDALADPTYARNQHQIFDNVDSDPLIRDTPEHGHPASRVELLEAIAPSRADIAEVRAAFIRFCRHHTQEGPAFSGPDTAVFGRVAEFTKLVNAVLMLAAACPSIVRVLSFVTRSMRQWRIGLRGNKPTSQTNA